MFLKHEKWLRDLERSATRLRCTREELTGRCTTIETVLSKLRDVSQFESFGDVKRFVESTIRQSNERVVRIGLKMKTMQSNLKFVKNELATKIDLGNAIKGIDFEIARIENNGLNKTLSATCKELLYMKDKEDKLNLEYINIQNNLTSRYIM
uniref:Uncharacterized protein n=1 Tax=Cacopsylla melanoneura TaxID=428564 RepID=A0A8D8S2N8_9HEMI